MIRPDALRAFWTLSKALDDVDGRVPCRGRTEDLYADDHRARRQAAALCADCPVLAQCGAFADANGERFGIWAGVDRTPTQPARRRTA
ncbi:WhiB family transcriptional regulator [Kineococcus sp. SYSU DK002]|uniref:WhiB family transcriptional regulator n=1 Tax=Kineococcus sp. SYSU DK002 TaxID=3383123 RepID=UPI003D7C7263